MSLSLSARPLEEAHLWAGGGSSLQVGYAIHLTQGCERVLSQCFFLHGLEAGVRMS